MKMTSLKQLIKLFTQKQKMYNWAKDVQDNYKPRSSRISKKSSGRSYKKSSSSLKTKSSRSSLGKASVKENTLEEKQKITE